MDERLAKPLRILSEAGIDYWLDSGTLLGIHREGDLIHGDGDIDLSILRGEVRPMFNMFHVFKEKGLGFEFMDTSEYHMFRLLETGDFDHTKKWEERILPVNIAIWELEGDMLTTPFNGALFMVPHDLVRPLDKSHAGWPIPGRTKEYLEYRYGPDWSTPDPDWNLRDDGMFHFKTDKGPLRPRDVIK